MNTIINTIYKTVIAAGLALTLGCRPKLLLENAPQKSTINSVGELSDLMNGFGTRYNNPNIRRIYLPEHLALEIRHDVDHDGVKDLAFRAGDIGYFKEAPLSIYYVIHSSELSDVAKNEYREQVEKILREYGIQLDDIKLRYPLVWHKHIPDFDGI